jgi:hypothetical protein
MHDVCPQLVAKPEQSSPGLHSAEAVRQSVDNNRTSP